MNEENTNFDVNVYKSMYLLSTAYKYIKDLDHIDELIKVSILTIATHFANLNIANITDITKLDTLTHDEEMDGLINFLENRDLRNLDDSEILQLQEEWEKLANKNHNCGPKKMSDLTAEAVTNILDEITLELGE